MFKKAIDAQRAAGERAMPSVMALNKNPNAGHQRNPQPKPSVSNVVSAARGGAIKAGASAPRHFAKGGAVKKIVVPIAGDAKSGGGAKKAGKALPKKFTKSSTGPTVKSDVGAKDAGGNKYAKGGKACLPGMRGKKYAAGGAAKARKYGVKLPKKEGGYPTGN